MMKKKYDLILTIGIFVLVGCGGFAPFSKEPLTHFGPDTIDTKLIGTWFWLPEDLPENLPENEEALGFFLHIGYAEDSSFLKCICVWMDENESGYFDFEGFPSHIEGNTYINLKWLNPMPELPEDISLEYIILQYHWKAEMLGIAFPAIDVIEQAIQEGRLKGTIVGNTIDQAIQEGRSLGEALAESRGFHIRITASQQELQVFFQTYDKDIFTEYTYLHKFRYQHIRRVSLNDRLMSPSRISTCNLFWS